MTKFRCTAFTKNKIWLDGAEDFETEVCINTNYSGQGNFMFLSLADAEAFAVELEAVLEVIRANVDDAEVGVDDTPDVIEIELEDGSLMSFSPSEAIGVAMKLLEATKGVIDNG